MGWPTKNLFVRGVPLPVPDEATLTAHDTIAAGDVLAVGTSGTDGGGFTATAAISARSVKRGFLCVAKQSAASGGPVDVAFRSDNVSIKATGTIARGDELGCEGANARVRAISAQDRQVAVALGASSGGFVSCVFNGVEGFGQNVEAALDLKASVVGATTAALAANTYAAGVKTADANGSINPIDGLTLVAGARLLVKDEGTGSENGIYVVTQVGTAGLPFILTRATDFDSSAEITDGASVFVEQGTANANTQWVLTTNDAITLDTTSLTFVQFGMSISYALVGAITTIAPDDAAAAGTAATAARGDHKHANATATAVGLTSASTSTEGVATSFGRSDHTHAITALTGASASTVADDNLVGGIPVLHRFTIPAGVTGDVDFVLTHKTLVTDVWLVKTAAAGGGAGTIQAKNGATAITNAMSIDVADTTVVRAGTIDDAQHEIAAAGTLRFTRTRTASSDESVIAYVLGVRRA